MATTTPEAPPEVEAPHLGTRMPRAWPISFALAIVFTFVLYQWILPNSSQQVRDVFRAWLPLSAVNEAVIWAIFALGLNVVVGYAGLLDLGYVAFWAIGGYTAAWLMSGFDIQITPAFENLKVSIFGHPPVGQETGMHVNFWLVLPIAGLFCALCGVIIGAPTLRLKSDYLALVTLGFGEIIPQIFTNGDDIGGWNVSNGPRGIVPIDPIPTGPFGWIPGVPDVLGPFDLTYKFLVYAGLAALFLFVSLRIREGRLGRAWLAIREDELAASMMGVPLMRTKLAAYGVGAFAGGIGGVAYATHVNAVLPDRFNFSISITLLAMVVLGGMGNVYGVVIGALGLAWINSTGLAQFGNTVNDALGTNINFPSNNFLLFGLILVLMMLFRREGLIPETRTRQVLREPERGELASVGADLEGDPGDLAAAAEADR
jgi:branched-chain amino acid transport system permease protein